MENNEEEPLDDGLFKKKKKGPEDKKKVNKTSKHALTPERMFFHPDERAMYAEYFNRLRDEVEEKGGVPLTTSQEITIDTVCYAVVRMERKSRQESNFGRFFDRVATQDPLNQINAGLKALGLLDTNRKESGGNNSNASLKDKLAEDAMNAELAIEAAPPSFEDWKKHTASEMPTYEKRTPEILPTYMDDDLIIGEEDESGEQAD